MDETSNEDKKSYRKITIKTPSLESNDQDKLKYVNVHNILQQINSQHFNQIGSKNNVQSSVNLYIYQYINIIILLLFYYSIGSK